MGIEIECAKWIYGKKYRAESYIKFVYIKSYYLLFWNVFTSCTVVLSVLAYLCGKNGAEKGALLLIQCWRKVLRNILRNVHAAFIIIVNSLIPKAILQTLARTQIQREEERDAKANTTFAGILFSRHLKTQHREHPQHSMLEIEISSWRDINKFYIWQAKHFVSSFSSDAYVELRS